MIKKAQALINLNAKIPLQNPILKLHSNYLIIISIPSMLSKYNILLNILNTKKDLIYNKTLLCLRAKKTELLDINILKKETAYYTDKDDGFF